MDRQDATGEQWRTKYQTLADEFEASSQQWQRQQEQWRRNCVALSLLAQGQDSLLDVQLRQLRKEFKRDQPGSTEIEPLESLLQQFEERTGQQQKLLAKSLQQAVASLAAGALTPLQQQRLEGLRLRIDDKLQSWLGTRELLAEWIQLLPVESLPHTTTAANKKIESVESPTVIDDPLRFHDGVCRGVRRLLGQLNLPADHQQQAERLRLQIEDKSDIDSLVMALDQLTDLVVASLADSQNELEGFLQQLDQQLQALQLHLGKDCLLIGEGQDSRQSLNVEVQQQVHELRSLVNSNTEISSLGSRIQHYLLTILSAIDRFEVREQAREQQQQQEMDELQQRLQEVEKQSADTRRALQQQRKLASRDALTGLPNRLTYNNQIRQIWPQLQQGQSLLIGVLDVDHFKRINDQYGHQAGDRVLKLIARVLRKQLPQQHFLARYGGEEFVLLLQDLDARQAQALANTLREAVAAVPYHFRGEPVSITVSIGLATAESTAAFEQVFAQADRALYQAKQQGRNRVVML
ncbi:GGDEF domain-containing protein [Oceanobacter mangrovi]|uniref:GGDEF domain-containing protein n=1 Tax=Oceanobacter mangrovi TaxID=2862510 RepID=UPI001C8D864D|nr:GGDEF domain-containing protein [Oceanobacter mangrovi]